MLLTRGQNRAAALLGAAAAYVISNIAHGRPLDTTAFVAGIPDSQFTSPKQLGAVLAKSAQCQECVVKQYFRYIAGRLETPADRPVIRKLLDDFQKSQFRFKELIVSLLLEREFPLRGGTAHVASNHQPH